ncbi:MAG: prepilin-type N-terminal cleavage/methylation domain-containing protein [Planctomycetales bacterium]|nr:prepilin-type N-terminal cleavage/methylation domain-containing protein [Planctomycetales bacterium]
MIRQMRGFSLVEMLVAISGSSLVLLAAAQMMHVAFNLSDQTQESVVDYIRLERLAQRFGHDVHQAQSMELTANECHLRSSSSSISYRVLENEIAVIETAGEDDIIQREQFALGRDLTARFEELEHPRRAVLRIQASNVSSATSRPIRIVEIAVGRLAE